MDFSWSTQQLRVNPSQASLTFTMHVRKTNSLAHVSPQRRAFHLSAVTCNHGLYGSTSCCISHGRCQWERAIFDPSTARRPLDRFSWNLKYITTFRTRPRVQNFRGLRRRGWCGQIASLTHESFCLLWKCRLPSNRVKNYGLYDQLGHVYCKHLKLVYMFTTRPMLRDHYVTWYTHWQSLMK